MADQRDGAARGLTALSRLMSHALRHEPARYGLSLDDAGWTTLDALAEGIARRKPQFAGVTAADLRGAAAASSKVRHEIDGSRIRATHGHSIAARVEHPVDAAPPARLYHGTAPGALAAILREGLRPMRRQHVHLAATLRDVHAVGRRHARTHAKTPVVLAIDTGAAIRAGCAFLGTVGSVWLCDAVRPDVISVLDTDDVAS